MKKKYFIKNKFLKIPVSSNTESQFVRLYSGNQTRLLNIGIAEKRNCDFTASYSLADYHGNELEIESDSETFFNEIEFSDIPAARADYTGEKRQQLHYSSYTGWLNDPNGLFYYDGIYHMFHQYNPLSARGGNMHWNHAVSKDLIHWKELDFVLAPDDFGTIYSGGAVIDFKNSSGLKANPEHPPILLFFTYAGDSAPEKREFTQGIAYSTDGGVTFKKYAKNPVIPNLGGYDERDPAVAYDEKSGLWIMLLYLGDKIGEFTTLVSSNLLDWKETYRFKIPATRECPDIFQLKDEASDEIKWVFIEANGKYLVGDFVDGKFIFETKTENFFVKQGNYFAYAGQTFCNSPDNSIYYIAWQRDFCESNKFSQSMTFPVELKLFNNKLLTLPVKSLKNLRKQRWTFNNIKDIPYIPVKSNLWELEIESNPDIAVSLSIDGVEFEFDPVNKKMLAGATTINYPDNESIFRGSIYFDHNSIEIFDYKGRFWASKAVTRRYNKTFSKIWPHVPGGIISKLTVHELASIWN